MRDSRFFKRTNVVATLGPATASVDVLASLFRAGLDVARLNFSHGTHEDHRSVIANLRAAADSMGYVPCILQDLQGPRIRIGSLNAPVVVGLGDTVLLTTNTTEDDDAIPVTYGRFHEDVAVGQLILIADGRVQLKIHKIVGEMIHCVCTVAGEIAEHKGVNVPEADLKLNTITKKDVHDLELGLREGVDYVALSFVRNADDIRELRHIMQAHRASGSDDTELPGVIAKIERSEAIDALDEIIDEADGIMIARGDLGIEVPQEKVPVYQRRIIDACLAQMKPVIVATHMLDSMTESPQPTRAELSDVAHAVMDHADAVMLSAETSIGKYPVEAVDLMSRIAHEAEVSPYDDLSLVDIDDMESSMAVAAARSAAEMSRRTSAKAIIVATSTGLAARMIARFRPELSIVAITNDPHVARRLGLVWGVVPVLSDTVSVDDMMQQEFDIARSLEFLSDGDRVIVASAVKSDDLDALDRVTVRTL